MSRRLKRMHKHTPAAVPHSLALYTAPPHRCIIPARHPSACLKRSAVDCKRAAVGILQSRTLSAMCPGALYVLWRAQWRACGNARLAASRPGHSFFVCGLLRTVWPWQAHMYTGWHQHDILSRSAEIFVLPRILQIRHHVRSAAAADTLKYAGASLAPWLVCRRTCTTAHMFS
jgi:hypothetical protein